MQSLSFPDSNLAMSDLLSNGTIDQFVLNISVQALLSQLLLLAPEDIEDAGTLLLILLIFILHF